MKLECYLQGSWKQGDTVQERLMDATTGEMVAEIARPEIDGAAVLGYARSVGGTALRKLTFHERAAALKNLARALGEKKGELVALSQRSGATAADCMLDIDGGIGTLYSYASRAARELPAGHVYIEGALESLSKSGNFVGQHICVPREGVALHINAFNFPVWGMLEKLAPTFLAGMPAVVKPASATAYVAEHLVRLLVGSKALPEGSVQLICGSVGNVLDHLQGQDVVAFTGSARTAQTLRAHPTILRHAVRFMAETDSLNASILGEDAGPDTPEFALFIAEVVREMTYKSGQRCTAIRRVFVPAAYLDAAADALKSAFASIVVGDPRRTDVSMGPLAGLVQRVEVLARIAELRREATLLSGEPSEIAPRGADRERGAFVSPTLLCVRDPSRSDIVHSVEAFGPVCTLMPYRSTDEVIELAGRGQGSLVASAFTADAVLARTLILGLAPYHGRVLIVNRDCGKEQTGHGSPMPGLIHGGPGRAGGSEELGGVRAVLHYMQRVAVQGTPAVVSSLNPL